jgi:parallel beta-helix repeat protein
MADIKISQLPAATLPLTGAELVPVVQSGVTKQTLAAAVGAGVVNVKAYGAVGDGVANDTAAIQAAINAAATGAEVFFPAGTYLTSASLTVTKSITLSGEGYGSTIRGANAGTYIIVLVQSATFAALNGVKIRDLRLDGNSGGQLDAGLLVLNNVVGGVVQGVWIENGTRTSGTSGVNGISASAGTPGGAGSQLVIRDCYLRNLSKPAINWTTESVEALIEGNHIRDITGNGTAPGIQLNGGFNGRVIGNYVRNTQGPGIYVSSDGSGNPSRNAVIANNVVDTCGVSSTTQGDGILITATSTSVGRIVVAGNNIYDCGTNTNGGAGIHVINHDNVVLNANLVRNNRYDGIRVQGCNHMSITANRCTGNNLAGVSFAGGIQIRGVCAHVAITGNHCSDDKGAPTQSYGIIFDGSATLTHLTVEANHLEGNVNGPLLADTIAKPMYLNMVGTRRTTNASASNVLYFQLPDDIAVCLTATAVGKKTDGSDRAIYSRQGLFYRDGGAATQQSTTTTLGTDIESNASWGGLGLIVSSNLVVPQVTGVASTDIDWRVDITLQAV